MQEVQDKINSLLDEAKSNGDHDIVHSYLSRVLVTTQYQHERLIACPEQVKIIDLLVSVLKEGYMFDETNYATCWVPDNTTFFERKMPKENPIYCRFVHSLNTQEVELEVIKADLKARSLWRTEHNTKIMSPETIDRWCFLFATWIRFTNIYLYCCNKFQQFGWKKLAWMLMNTTFETYETSMQQIDQMLREEHGYDGFVYRKNIVTSPSEYGLSAYMEGLDVSSKLQKLIE